MKPFETQPIGIMTAFFIAGEHELRSAFPGWLPVAPQKYRPVQNPHTGEMQLDWGPLQDEAEPSTLLPQNEYEVLHQFSQYVEFEQMDIVKCAILQEILCKITFSESLNAWDKPALMQIGIENQGLVAFPSPLTLALSTLNDLSLTLTAQQWAETEEMEMYGFNFQDTVEVLTYLRNYALLAGQQNKKIYLWWRYQPDL